MSKGYFCLSASSCAILVSSPAGHLAQFEAWYWLIEAAAFAVCEVPVMNGDRREIITLQPGQLSHSIRFLGPRMEVEP